MIQGNLPHRRALSGDHVYPYAREEECYDEDCDQDDVGDDIFARVEDW